MQQAAKTLGLICVVLYNRPMASDAYYGAKAGADQRSCCFNGHRGDRMDHKPVVMIGGRGTPRSNTDGSSASARATPTRVGLWQADLDRLFVICVGTVKFAPGLECFAATVVSCRVPRI